MYFDAIVINCQTDVSVAKICNPTHIRFVNARLYCVNACIIASKHDKPTYNHELTKYHFARNTRRNFQDNIISRRWYVNFARTHCIITKSFLYLLIARSYPISIIAAITYRNAFAASLWYTFLLFHKLCTHPRARTHATHTHTHTHTHTRRLHIINYIYNMWYIIYILY